MTLVMYDTVTVDTVPSNPPAVAGYVGGSWPTYNGLVARFPQAYHLSIAVNSGERARCLDIEPGDASAGEAPGWLRNHFAILPGDSKGKPVLYTSASNVQAVINACSSAGIARNSYLIWSAHYNGQHICGPGTCGYPQADGTQFTDTALGRNLDQSVVNDYFFGPPPPPPDPHHYLWFAAGPFPSPHWGNLNEQLVVQQYDGARQHPIKYRIYLKKNLEPKLQYLADRVWTVAHHPLGKDGKPTWSYGNRGWRYQQLKDRAAGKRFV